MSKRKRRIAALILPGVIEIVYSMISGALSWVPGNNIARGVEFILMLVAGVILCVLILRDVPFDGFWKNYFFAFLSATLPWSILIAVSTIISGTDGYWLLAMTLFGFFIAVAAVCSLPLVWFLVKYPVPKF